MTSRGIHHLGVAVDDLDAAIGTYGALFGATLEHREGDGVTLIDDRPRRGLFGLEVAFIHPEATGGVLAELVSHDG